MRRGGRHVSCIGAPPTVGARARPDAPSPLELARQLLRQPQPGGGGATAATNAAGREAARLVVSAAQPWSPQTHELWPARGRARAEALVRLGWRLSSTDRSPGPFGNEAQSIMDAWRGLVMVHALVRAECAAGEGDDGRGTRTQGQKKTARVPS